MRKLALGLAAAGALVAVTAVPAIAQVEFYAGPGGFDVEVAPHYYGHDYYPYRGYYDEYRGPGWAYRYHPRYFHEW